MSKSLFIALALAMTLAACGKTEAPKPAADAATTAPAAPAAPPADAAAPAAPAAAGSEEEKERVRKQNAAAEAALSGH